MSKRNLKLAKGPLGTWMLYLSLLQACVPSSDMKAMKGEKRCNTVFFQEYFFRGQSYLQWYFSKSNTKLLIKNLWNRKDLHSKYIYTKLALFGTYAC